MATKWMSDHNMLGFALALQMRLQTSELRSCVKVEVAVLGSPSLISLVVSVDVKQD